MSLTQYAKPIFIYLLFLHIEIVYIIAISNVCGLWNSGLWIVKPFEMKINKNRHQYQKLKRNPTLDGPKRKKIYGLGGEAI